MSEQDRATSSSRMQSRVPGMSTKRLLSRARDLDVAGVLALETELQLGLLGTPNQMEAVQAVMTKRDPAFRDPD